MKKNIFIILCIIFSMFLAIGCTDNKSNAQPSTTNDIAQPNVISRVEKSTSTQPVYQDVAWSQYTQRCSPLIGTDFTNVASAIDNLDYTALATDGQNIVDDTQKALDENDQYSISPKNQEAQNEWVLALTDYNSAGKYIILVANDGKIGKTNSENLNKVTSLCSSGTGHLNRAKALIQSSAGTA